MRRKSPAHYKRAQNVLEALGYKVTFGTNVRNIERFGTASVEDRLADFHQAYRDPQVMAIIAAEGGWVANALLPGIDWQLLRTNPKPLIGFSDITVLINAIYAQTGQTGYLGPNFSTLGNQALLSYAVENLATVLTNSLPSNLVASREWQRTKDVVSKTSPWKVLQPGQASGRLIGGNLGTFYLLQGTAYQPVLDTPYILAVEDDAEAGTYTRMEFDRRLESILQLPGARENLRGILVGRFEQESRVSMPDIGYIIERLQVKNVPVIAGVDFGHTWPRLTLPIGGIVGLSTTGIKPTINLLEY